MHLRGIFEFLSEVKFLWEIALNHAFYLCLVVVFYFVNACHSGGRHWHFFIQFKYAEKMVAECIGWIFSFGHKRASNNPLVAYFSTFESHQKKRAAAHTQ